MKILHHDSTSIYFAIRSTVCSLCTLNKNDLNTEASNNHPKSSNQVTSFEHHTEIKDQTNNNGGLETSVKLYSAPTSCKENEILIIDGSPCKRYLIAAYANKTICCWDIESTNIIAHCIVKKRPTAIAFAAINNKEDQQSIVIISDKAGDVYGIPIPSLSRQVHLMGHCTSVITDMIRIDSMLITSDRDEKIRISSFPHATRIIHYCLGHHSVVSSLDLLIIPSSASTPSLANGYNWLVSTGWDHKLCLWDVDRGQLMDAKIMDGKQPTDQLNETVDPTSSSAVMNGEEEGGHEADDVAEEEADADEKKYEEVKAGNYPYKVVTSKHPMDASPLIAVLFKNSHQIILFSIEVRTEVERKEETRGFFSTELGRIDCPSDSYPVDAIFIEPDLLMVGCSLPSYFHVYRIHTMRDETSQTRPLSSVAVSEVTKQFKGLDKVVALCLSEGVTYSQQSLYASSGGGADVEHVVSKHQLDKPFDKKTIDFESKKGAKRSKRIKN